MLFDFPGFAGAYLDGLVVLNVSIPAASSSIRVNGDDSVENGRFGAEANSQRLSPALIESGTVRIRLGSASSVHDIRAALDFQRQASLQLENVAYSTPKTQASRTQVYSGKSRALIEVNSGAASLGSVKLKNSSAKYKSCRNLATTSTVTLLEPRTESGSCPESTWSEESFKEYLSELQKEYETLKTAIKSAMTTEESIAGGSVKSTGTSVTATVELKLGRSVSKMDEMLRRIANLNSILGNSRVAEVTIREKIKTMGDRELHLTKVIEEQSGLVEVAKRKVAKMVKDIAEERRRRKDGEKKFVEEKQDLREQNELLEFRLLELDAWKQQHQGFLDDAKSEIVGKLDMLAQQTPADFCNAVYGPCWFRDDDSDLDEAPDDNVVPNDFASGLIHELSETSEETDFGALWRVSMTASEEGRCFQGSDTCSPPRVVGNSLKTSR
ncbi:unnamed protein product [Notodromas monacha]|uniref:Uncharacterized protein n=1 Tax=Notodromas monacha TaxID=399045 RepID=A0A7R9BQD5_9CRUS|nr:unnamed protein product [Notodromas monacha]CAG0919741.1 unnamed protein product [Notodromas monacha]